MTITDKVIVVFVLAACGLAILVADPAPPQCVTIGTVIKLAGDCSELRGVDY